MRGMVIGRDCGNSTRKLFLQEFYLAIYQGESDFVGAHLHEQIKWEFPGITFEDKESCIKYLRKYHSEKIAELSILKIITHGAEAVVLGTISREDGMGYQFCDVFTFVSAGKSAIKSISSFQK